MKLIKKVMKSKKKKMTMLNARIYRIVKKVYFLIIPKSVRLIVGKVNQNLILLDSPYYKDNIKVLAEYILEHKPQYKVICFVEKDQPIEKHKNMKFIRRSYRAGDKNAYSIAAYYYGLKAKYVFYTHSFKWVGEKNDGQIIINLWHGSGYKGGEQSTIEHNFDFMMVPGNVFIKSKAEFFNCEESKILTLGYPRYDLFNKKCESINTKFFEKLNINLQEDKLIIWLPTFVPDEYLLTYENPLPYIFSGFPLIENLNQAIELDEFCQKNKIKLLVKKHNLRYSVTPLDNHLEKFKNIMILSDEEFKIYNIELYELLPFTAGLISDFSSVSVDYMLLDKPIAYTLSDIEDYKKTRGFVFDNPLEYMPGDHVYTFEQLKCFMLDVVNGLDKHQALRHNKMETMHNITDNYSKRILDYFNL
jgi:CDP-glycerol glycerophosphotransferase (TagB/SpsB family)